MVKSQGRNTGRVVAIQGSVVDVRFDNGAPGLHAQLLAGDKGEIVIEVASIVGPKTVRGLVLTTNDQLSLGMIESTAIYCFVVSMILLFANPFADLVASAGG